MFFQPIGIAAGYAYLDKNDTFSTEINSFNQANAFREAVNHFSNLHDDNSLTGYVIKIYKMQRRGVEYKELIDATEKYLYERT